MGKKSFKDAAQTRFLWSRSATQVIFSFLMGSFFKNVVVLNVTKTCFDHCQSAVYFWHRLSLYDITAAVMFVMRQLFAMPKRLLLVPPDERRGTFLMNEILYGGNFGQYDPQSIQANTPWRKNMLRLKRDWRLLTIFPSECLWEPIFRWWHFFWRQLH